MIKMLKLVNMKLEMELKKEVLILIVLHHI